MLPEDLTKVEALDQVLGDLHAREAELAKRAEVPNTLKSYRSDARKFVEWCEQMSFSALPAASDTLRLYFVYLDKIGRKPSTMTRALTAIRKMHRLKGYDPPGDEALRQTMRNIRAVRGVARSKKTALTLDKLERVLRFVPRDLIGIRDRTILLVGWTGALRRSEIVSLDLADVEAQSEGLVLTIRRGKTDQLGKGRKIGLPYLDPAKHLCAARALTYWISMSGIADGPLFQKIGKSGRGKLVRTHVLHGQRLSDKQISRVVKIYCDDAGYNPDDYSGHSLRSGLATTLASVGIEERKIMQITGHRSLPVLREYIQHGELFREHPVIALINQRIAR